MENYIVATIKYTDRPSNGKHTPAVLNDLLSKSVGRESASTLTLARKYAYQKLSHKGFNGEGKYLCLIIKVKAGPLNHKSDPWECIISLAGEVLNTAFDDRYWYPSTDGIYASAGKYTLYKDGTLGRRLR